MGSVCGGVCVCFFRKKEECRISACLVGSEICMCNMGCFGLLWAALGCFGLLWAALGCFGLLGLLWAALGCSGLLWAALDCFGLLWAALGGFPVPIQIKH